MSDRRYQLWMRLMFLHPGRSATAPLQGRANFEWRILDTRSPDYDDQRAVAVTYGCVLLGNSEDLTDIATMLGVPEGQSQQMEQAQCDAKRYVKIQDARAALQKAPRFDCVATSANAVMRQQSNLGKCVDSEWLDYLQDILR